MKVGYLLGKAMGEREGRKAIVAVLADWRGRVGGSGAKSNDSKKLSSYPSKCVQKANN